jgi:hypothetical protein
MPFTTTTTCDSFDANPIRSSSNFDWHSFLSLPQEQRHMSTVDVAMSLRSLPFSPTVTLYGVNDHYLSQTRSSTTGDHGIDRLIAILDAALEIVEESDDVSRDESCVVDDPSFSHTCRNFGHSTSISYRRARGRKTSRGDRRQ